MKKRRKRSASSASSSSASSRRTSSSSSSSSPRRRSKKKKKKKRRSGRESKRHHRISSRDSRRSEEGKSEKDDEELEWYPAPPNTSATFLNHQGGPIFVERGETEAEEKDAEVKRTTQLYSLLGGSDDEESDSTHRGRKRRDRGKDGTSRNSQSQEGAERMSGSRERKDRSGERGKDDGQKDRRDSGPRRRSSLGEDRKRNVSCSSAESEYSRKSTGKSELFGNSASKQVESGMRHATSRRMSLDGRYENTRGREEIQQVKTAAGEMDGRKGRVQEEGRRSEAADGIGNLKRGLTSAPGGGPKRELPSNLLDIFNQIAQFEKEKGARPK